MATKKKNKNVTYILVGLVIAIVILIVYAMFAPSQQTVDQNGLQSVVDGARAGSRIGDLDSNQAQLANSQILSVLSNIKNIQLEDDIFANPVFRDLRDSQLSIPDPVQIGRPNPFIPYGFDSFDATSQGALDQFATNSFGTSSDVSVDTFISDDGFFTGDSSQQAF